ncbi:hypothetical protein OO013_10990 [Mangrovivirga sp. M17]|uniref:Uncharacterized protein n=1 Tax=Mangrovivirga halotolerans TaxID=2993936 RepID=A0ABT3RSD1_9BACT|nr:hypothetical protein [Mangrovivirga halotolerans]MCX2744396.1 hypothetical protein [Mangrovivirga halotolerans]
MKIKFSILIISLIIILPIVILLWLGYSNLTTQVIIPLISTLLTAVVSIYAISKSSEVSEKSLKLAQNSNQIQEIINWEKLTPKIDGFISGFGFNSINDNQSQILFSISFYNNSPFKIIINELEAKSKSSKLKLYNLKWRSDIPMELTHGENINCDIKINSKDVDSLKLVWDPTKEIIIEEVLNRDLIFIFDLEAPESGLKYNVICTSNNLKVRDFEWGAKSFKKKE